MGVVAGGEKKVTMGEDTAMKPEDESSEEQVEKVDTLIDLCQKLFLLSTPGSTENEAELAAEVQKTVTERGERSATACVAPRQS